MHKQAIVIVHLKVHKVVVLDGGVELATICFLETVYLHLESLKRDCSCSLIKISTIETNKRDLETSTPAFHAHHPISVDRYQPYGVRKYI